MKRNKQTGFTIIEVLIVLVLAGLILMIVFLAIPALQRNARNTRRKRDLGRFYTALLEYQSATDTNLAPFPGSGGADDAAYNTFINNYLPADMRPSASGYKLTPKIDSGSTLHNHGPAEDEIIYFAFHHCRIPGTPVPPDEALSDAVVLGSNHNLFVYAVLIGVEKNTYYCIDNGS